MKHISLLITFLIIVSINANGRENPFEPTQTYESEVARLVEIDEDYPYEFQEKEDQEESKKSMKKAEKKVVATKDEMHTQAAKPKMQKKTTLKPAMKTEVKSERKKEIKQIKEEMAPVVAKVLEKAITIVKKEDNDTNITPIQEVKEAVMGDQEAKKAKIISLEKAMKELKEDEIVVDVPKRADIEVHENIDILPFINIDYTNNKIEIKSKYDVFRKFTIDQSNKIVLDYHAKTYFLTKSKKMNTTYFDKVIIGNHLKDRYFRIVIVLKNKPNKYKVTYLDNLVTVVFDKDMI